MLRIVPAYWAALTLAVVVGVAVNVTPENAAIYYLFAQTYTTETYAGGMPQSWTLCIEIAFYAMLPVWALTMRARRAHTRAQWLRQELIGLAVLVAISQIYKLVLAFSVDVNSFGAQPLMMALPHFLDALALGMALAVATVWQEDSGRTWWAVRVIDRRSWLPWALAGVAFGVAVLVGPSGEIGQQLTRTDYLLRHELWTLCALGLVLPGMLGDPRRGVVRGLLARRSLLFVGLVSYGLFLHHITVYMLLERWGMGSIQGNLGAWFVWTLVGMLGSLALGTLSYYALERPFLSLKRLVPARPRDTGGEALAEPTPLAPPEPASVARSGPPA